MTFRWILIGLSAVLAVALIAFGNVVIGAIIGVMVVAHVFMLLSIRRRRQEFASRFPGHVPARARRTPD